MMRILDEVGRLLARVSLKRKQGDTDDAALETVVFGFQRLFGLDADQIFSLTPAQQYELLARDELPEFARDKILMYAALCAEAGHVYTRQGNGRMARATFINALRFSLKARAHYSSVDLPAFAPDLKELTQALAAEPLDPETAQLLADEQARG